jgi:NAD+ kinase
VKKIGLVVKEDAEACKKADELEKWLVEQGHRIVRKTSRAPQRNLPEKGDHNAPEDLFCVFVLGGDGTLLSAVRWIGDRQIPVLGIKFGEVGFLAETSSDNLGSVVANIMDQPFTTSERMRLKVSVFREGRPIHSENVLNDIVINKGVLARLAYLKTFIDDKHLTDYRADGLIISTPTGSTAYSLAAGGPIMHPFVPGILIAPICPFTLTNRPLIVPDSVTIKIRLGEKASDIHLTFDGQLGFKIDERDTITVTKSPYPVNLITLPDQEYFDVLKAKLRWSGSRV